MLLDLLCYDERPMSVDSKESIIGPDGDDTLASAEKSELRDPCLIMFGRQASGRSICVTFDNYKPWCRIMCTDANDRRTSGFIKSTVARVLRIDMDLITVKQERLPKFYGFVPGVDGPLKFPCFKIYLPSFALVSRLENVFKSSEFEFTEKSTPHNVRAMNELGLTISGWASITGTESSCKISTCNSEFIASSIISKDILTIAPLKICSFDAEMYSHDNGFPEVMNGDFTIAVCCTMWSYGSEVMQRKAFVLWTKEPLNTTTPGLDVVYCSSSQDLFERLRDYIVTEDPDLLTGWNIYGFDMPFMWDEYCASMLRPSQRGSEALRADLLKKLQRPFHTTSTLLSMASKAKVPTKSLIDKLDFRIRRNILDPESLPQHATTGLRQSLRQSLNLDVEPTLSGPLDLEALRAYSSANPGERHARLFKSVVDVPKYQGSRAMYLSRLCCDRSQLSEKRMSSAGKGENTYYFWSGRGSVDLMQIIKDDKKLDDNSLKYSAQVFLDPEYGKIDLSPVEIFKAFREQDPIKMASMVDYCARDADIPLMLIKRLAYVPQWVEMSRVTFTSLHSVLNGGQQRKVYNLIARFVHNEYALNHCDSGWPISKIETDDTRRKSDYQGATVIEPKSGFYTESVSTLDFESLYPSIIIHFNLCPSVYVVPGQRESKDYVYETHEIHHSILSGPDTYDDFSRQYSFVKNVQGVIPRLLQHLLRARKTAKKAMAAATDDFERSVQNGRQLALKVSCNSVYGFFGVTAGRGLMSCKPVAAVTTLKGRAFIEAAKNYVEGHYNGSDVLYGDTDSIMIKWGPGITIPQAYLLAEEASAAITVLLRNGDVPGTSRPLLATASSAVTLANEKVYVPYLLIQKKNYAAMKYTLKGGRSASGSTLADYDSEMDMKGIDAVRRDRSKLVKSISESILDALLIKQDLNLALDSLKQSLMLVAAQKAPLEWFVLSKSLKSTYKTDNQPHVQAWKRMMARGDSDIPDVGTRMPFVVVESLSKGPLYTHTEHPEYVKTAKLRYDAKYYLDNAQDVVERLLGPTGRGSLVRRMFSDALEAAEAKSSGSMSLMMFKKARA